MLIVGNAACLVHITRFSIIVTIDKYAIVIMGHFANMTQIVVRVCIVHIMRCILYAKVVWNVTTHDVLNIALE